MTTETAPLTAATKHPQDKQRGALKTKRAEIDPAERLPKPDWIRVKAALPLGRFREIKDIVRANQLVTVCEEASCPNIGECWSKGTATVMIMGDRCTRRCRVLTWCQDHVLREEKRESAFANIPIRVASSKIVPNLISMTA